MGFLLCGYKHLINWLFKKKQDYIIEVHVQGVRNDLNKISPVQ